MTFENILVTSQFLYLDRFQHLFNSLSSYFDKVDYLPLPDLPTYSLPQRLQLKAQRVLYRTTGFDYFAPIDPLKTVSSFVNRSIATEKRIRQLPTQPDLIFHVFCLSSPLWRKRDIPYAMFLDYTMALARRNWQVWAPFRSQQAYAAWLNQERRTYQQAHRLFCVSQQVKSSLVNDYGIAPEKITVTGSSANFPETYPQKKQFGSKQLMFNGSDFERKGGDLVLEAFRQVRQVIPDAKLVIFGAKLPIEEAGIENPGHIASREAMQQFLLNTDLVLAPARCDPFPVFPMEAMNYGVPCIVSGCDGNPDIVDDQVNGILIPQPNAQLLAEKIITLLQSPETLQSLSEQAKQKIRTTLNWPQVARTIAKNLV